MLFLSSVWILALHLAIFFQVALPLFGNMMFGRQAIYIIAFLIVTLLILVYGMIRLKLWAWWGALAYFSVLGVSVTMTFMKYSFSQIVSMMKLPEYEIEFLAKLVVLQNYRLIGFVAIPFFLTWGLLVYSRKYFFSTEVRS